MNQELQKLCEALHCEAKVVESLVKHWRDRRQNEKDRKLDNLKGFNPTEVGTKYFKALDEENRYYRYKKMIHSIISVVIMAGLCLYTATCIAANDPITGFLGMVLFGSVGAFLVIIALRLTVSLQEQKRRAKEARTWLNTYDNEIREALHFLWAIQTLLTAMELSVEQLLRLSFVQIKGQINTDLHIHGRAISRLMGDEMLGEITAGHQSTANSLYLAAKPFAIPNKTNLGEYITPNEPLAEAAK